MKKLAFLAAGALALAACQTLPLQNIEGAPVHMAKKHYGLGDVEKAIVRAGTNLGWQMRTVKPGQVNGKLYQDDMVAEVCRRILVLLSQPVLDWQEEFVPRLVRLPLAIMRDRGWQPVKYGGDGTVDVNLDVAPISQAVATTLAPGDDYLGYFFGTSV